MPNRELRWGQTQQLMRLVGEAADIPVDGGLRRQHTLAGLARIIGSPAGLVATGKYTPGEGDGWGISWLATTGRDAVTQPVFLRMHKVGYSENPTIAAWESHVRPHAFGTQYVAAEHDLVSKREWEQSSYVADFVRPAGLDHCLISVREFDHSGNYACFFRCRNDRPFDDRDYNLVQLFAAEGSNLLWGPQGRILPKRLQQIFEQLIAGQPAKCIAAHLGLSLHTVNEHIGTLYRRFEVRSRGELFAHLRATQQVAGKSPLDDIQIDKYWALVHAPLRPQQHGRTP